MHCLSCSTNNPEVARFCFNCGNPFALEVPITPTIAPVSGKVEVDSWGYQLVKRLPMPYWVSLTLIWQLVLVADYLLATAYKEKHHLVFHFLVYTCWGMTVVIIEFCNREMKGFYPKLLTFVDEPEEKLQVWYTRSLKQSYSNPWSLVLGVSVAVIGPLTVYPMLDSITGAEELLWFRLAINAVGFFVMANGVWAIFTIILMVSKLSSFKIHVRLFAIGNDSIMSLGSLFLRMAMAISMVYLFILAAAVIGGFIDSYIVLAWNAVAIVSIISFFIVPQYKIHKLMVQEKQERMRSFSKYLEEAMNESLKDPSMQKMKDLRELFELKAHMAGMHEWTFRAGTIGQLISILIIPMLLVFLEVLLSR